MRSGVDTNVLVYAHAPGSPNHTEVLGYLTRRLANPRDALVLVPDIVAEFVHIITDERRIVPPFTMQEAMDITRNYLGRANVTCIEMNAAIVELGFELLQRHRLGRRRITDTMLVAALMHHDVPELITCDPKDFAIFDEVRVIDPRAKS